MIGQPRNRVDGRDKVTGRATYSAEWPIEDLAYGVIVQSSIARGTITAIDADEASRLPGVRLVMTHENAPRLPEKGRAGVDPPAGRVLTLLQDAGVHYNGQPIALVVADTLEDATHAAASVKVTYRERPAAIDLMRELPRAEPVTEKLTGDADPSSARGDVDGALAGADTRVDAIYTTPVETHNAMEPHATIAHWNGDALTLYDATQFVFGVKRFVAKTLGLDQANVRVVSKFVGGAFGSKGSSWSHVVLAAMAARELQRPVTIVLTRRQMFGIVGARPHTVQRIVLGATRDGGITAIRQEVTSSTSTIEDWIESSSLQTRMLYDVANVETSQKIVRLNLGTPTFNRGPGESSGTFGLESAIDELAWQLGLDPIDVRLTNYAETDPESGLPFSSKSLRECYRRGAERFGWTRRTREPRSMRDGRLLVGMGMATATYPRSGCAPKRSCGGWPTGRSSSARRRTNSARARIRRCRRSPPTRSASASTAFTSNWAIPTIPRIRYPPDR